MSNTTMTDSNDRMGQTCTECGVGRYQETSIHDDWDGVLHCTNKACNHEVIRYKWKDDPKPQPEPVKAELSPATQAVLDAADAVLEQGNAPTWLVARGIAAALRASAKQSTFADVAVGKTIEVVPVDILLAIAAELEAQTN